MPPPGFTCRAELSVRALPPSRWDGEGLGRSPVPSAGTSLRSLSGRTGPGPGHRPALGQREPRTLTPQQALRAKERSFIKSTTSHSPPDPSSSSPSTSLFQTSDPFKKLPCSVPCVHPHGLHTSQLWVPPAVAGLGAVGKPPLRYDSGVSLAPGTGTPLGSSSGGPWVLGSPGGPGCTVGLVGVDSLLGLWGCSRPFPVGPGGNHVPHTSFIMASGSGFPTYTWVTLSQALTSFCGYHCHHHSPPKKAYREFGVPRSYQPQDSPVQHHLRHQ